MYRQPGKRVVLVSSAAVAVLVVAACNPESPQDRPDSIESLTGTEITEVLSGNTLTGAPSEQTPWSVHYKADGTEFGLYGADTDTGRWRVRDNQLCSNWDNWGEGERCFELQRDDSGTIMGVYDGEPEWSAVLETGDSRSLDPN